MVIGPFKFSLFPDLFVCLFICLLSACTNLQTIVFCLFVCLCVCSLAGWLIVFFVRYVVADFLTFFKRLFSHANFLLRAQPSETLSTVVSDEIITL